jgi:hypothetical protein
MSETRRQKRAYEKYLKKVDPIKYNDWKSKSLDRVKEAKVQADKERADNGEV